MYREAIAKDPTHPEGRWTVSGVVPPGLAGHSVTLESFAIGFTGKVVDTQPMVLAFE